jgi:hypothetical protein
VNDRFPNIKDPVAFTEALEAMFRQAETHPDPRVRDLVLDISEAVMRLHHEALFRIVTLLRNVPGGGDVLEVLRGDQVVGTLFADHSLLDEPDAALDARITEALEKVTLRQLRHLARYTRHHLALTNQQRRGAVLLAR